MEKDAPEDLEAALNALKDDQLELVTYMGEQAHGSVFCVNLTRIIECCQLVLVETAIRSDLCLRDLKSVALVKNRDRFGMHALRIFRLLLLKKQLEQKQIADLSMLDLKETRTVLYRMMKAGYVQMQVGEHSG